MSPERGRRRRPGRRGASRAAEDVEATQDPVEGAPLQRRREFKYSGALHTRRILENIVTLPTNHGINRFAPYFVRPLRSDPQHTPVWSSRRLPCNRTVRALRPRTPPRVAGVAAQTGALHRPHGVTPQPQLLSRDAQPATTQRRRLARRRGSKRPLQSRQSASGVEPAARVSAPPTAEFWCSSWSSSSFRLRSARSARRPAS